MDFLSAGSTEIVRTVGETSYSFQKLKRSQAGTLHAQWAAQERAAEQKRLDEAGVQGTERAEALRAFDAECAKLGWLFMRVIEPKRGLEIIKLSAPSQDVDDLPFSLIELNEIACDLIGLPRKEDDDDTRPLDASGPKIATGS